MKKSICLLLILIITASSIITSSAADSLPAPDWVRITLNADASKTLTITTPTYMIDKVDYYEYSTDDFVTAQKLRYNEGGEFVFETNCKFSLRYYSNGFMSETYTVDIIITKTTVITSHSTNISILIPLGSPIPTDITISGYEITGGNDYNTAKKKIGEHKKFRLYSVAVMRNNKEYKTTTPYNFLFPCSNFDVRYCKVYRMDSKGNITLIESVPEMNMLLCKTDMTGLFLVVEDKMYSPGDLNGDGKILANDARLALRISAKLETATEQQTVSGDINKNGHIDASDARKILRAAASLEKLN